MPWYTILLVASMANLWVYSKPTILFRRYLDFKDENYDSYSKIKQLFLELMTCSFCSAFWIGTFWLDLHIMCIGSIVALAIEKYIMLK